MRKQNTDRTKKENAAKSEGFPFDFRFSHVPMATDRQSG